MAARSVKKGTRGEGIRDGGFWAGLMASRMLCGVTGLISTPTTARSAKKGNKGKGIRNGEFWVRFDGEFLYDVNGLISMPTTAARSSKSSMD